jgi:aminopeptidase N
MLHTIRQLVNDDAKWRRILRGLQSTFRHQTVAGRQVEQYIDQQSGLDLDKVFAQYLETTQIPVLEYKLDGSKLSYRWANVVKGFDMPVRVALSSSKSYTLIRPTESWQTVATRLTRPDEFRVDENFYVEAKNVGAQAATDGTPRR